MSAPSRTKQGSCKSGGTFFLANNSSAPPREDPGLGKIYCVREFLGSVLKNSQGLYSLDQEVPIEETMVLHKEQK